jgi:hypothetical protein
MPRQSMKHHAMASRLDEQVHSSKQNFLFANKPQHTTTGKLLLEIALFAVENKRFQESRDMTAGDRAQIHLQHIRELSDQRQAELATLMRDNS